MPHATVCHRHRKLIPIGETCPQCERHRAEQTAQRSATSNRELGRNTRHWRRLSGLARKLHPYCAICGRPEGTSPALKLTVDLIGGGNHATAALEQTRVAHRSCHGKADGGTRRHSSAQTARGGGLNTQTPATNRMAGDFSRNPSRVA